MEVGGLDGFRAEEALDAGQGPGGSAGGLGFAAPEAELAALVGDHLVGDQGQVGEGAGGMAGAPGQPAVELPADPLGHDGGHAGRRVDGIPGTRPTASAPGPGTRPTAPGGDRVGAGPLGWEGGGVGPGAPGEGLALVGRGVDAEAGAGQAEPLEADGAVHMCPDEWLMALGFDIYDKDARVSVEALQWELAQQLVLRGLTVVDECGVWQRWERDLRREWARAHGVPVELRFLDAPVDVLTARVAERNRTLPEGAPRIDPALVAFWHDRIERPDADELALFD